MKDQSQSVRDESLWQRILLVGLTGAVPLFVVSLVLLNVAYSDAIEFGVREQRGNAFQGSLEGLLELLPRYELAARQEVAGETEPRLELSDVERKIDAALRVVTADLGGEVGRALGLTDAAPGSRNSIALQAQWDELKRAPRSVVASGEAVSRLSDSVHDMIRRTGDRSNLILDDDLDSFYLMDITLGALPETQQRIADVTLRVSDWLRSGRVRANETRIAVMAEMLRHDDLARVTRDAQISLSEDSRFNGVSPSLHLTLPPAVQGFEAAAGRFLALLDRVAADEAVPVRDFEAAGLDAHAESFRLFRTGASELHRLLSIRVDAIRNRRLRGYSIIIATLALAAAVMGMIMRNLLASRYAEIMRTQGELRAKETQLRAVGDNLPGGMVYQVMRDFDGTMRFLYVSAGIEHLHGVPAEAALSDSAALYGRILPEDLPLVRDAERESLTRKAAFKVVVRMRARDDAVRWMELISAPRHLPDGRVVWDGIELDITDRKLAEAASKNSEQRFTHIFDNSPIPITLSGSDGKFIAANDSFMKFSGFTREEVIGHMALELGIYPEPSQRAYIMEQLRLHGRLHGHEQAFRTKSGKVCQTVMWLDLMTIGGDQCILVIATDVTEQKEAAQQQRELEEQLRQAQKLEAIGTLAGGIAHDFNNILGGIVSYTELSKLENPGNETLQENLDEVLKASTRAATLVRQILSFSRHQKEARTNLQLAPIVKEALSLLRATLPSTITLQQRIGGALPDVLANPTQVHQIIMNLCTNAAHAMRGKQGQLTVEVDETKVEETAQRRHVELRPGNYVYLTVTDTGHGMDAATSKRIFEPFFTTKGAGEGTGLGLSVVHGIVKEYEGAVTVDSELGRGTSISIYLPARPAIEERPPIAAAEIPRGNGERVLFVDDEPVLGDVARKMMQRLGYRAEVFQSSEAALAAFQKEPTTYDVLITDLTMPEMTGVDLARRVLSIRPTLPVILVSGSSGPLTVAELGEMGIRELLGKPLDYATLARVLSQMLQP